ncbi:UDP-glucuronic acid decarboxylase family protein [Nocardioides sp. URHA0020]|uniref:UDP-glucuronic acid decarboxylase family protein n=1 Tax=Nocardioides sp. URHA0020 TaxID=1380392 RepID=UPI00055F89BF|nr:UDP-glucuronic acid decarboxylase family protein [Nocardioides sp. URHA0020]
MRAGVRVVVTGGAGFLGSWLCRRLLADGADVVCLDSLVTGARANVAELESQPGFTFVEADVCDPIALDGPVDVVFHLASVASPVHYLRLPLETLRTGSVGTTNVLDLAERTGARFLLASTSEVYGDPLEHPQHESYWGNVNPIGPRSVYDEAKRFAEATTAAYRRCRGVDTTIARIFNTYGPRMALDDGRVVPAFVQQALAGQPLTVAGDGTQTRSLCWVEDTVDGLVRLAASSSSGPVNIGAEDETTVLELATTIRRLVGSTSSIDFVPLPQDDPRLRCPDITEAMGLLGWAPRMPLEQGLSATVDWVRERLGADLDRQPA